METLRIRTLRIVLCSAAVGLGLTQAATAQISNAELNVVLEAEQRRIEVIERVYPTVVAIYGENPAAGGGSGVVFDPRGYVMTNFHVVQGAGGKKGWAGLADGKLYRWRLIGMDPGGDLAIIQLQGKDVFAYSTFADSDTVSVGDWAMAMGNPFALADNQQPTVTLGIVSGTHRYQGGMDGGFLVYGNCIQIDSSINPGNSGGPLFNMDGKVIGINGRGSFEERGRVNVGLGYAISANQVKYFIPELLSTKTTLHANLDATFIDLNGTVICNAFDLDQCPLVNLPSGNLELGDQLLRFNGKAIGSANEYLNEKTMLPAGWPVTVEWLHEGERRSATVRMNALPYGQPPRQRPQPRVQPRRDGEAPQHDPVKIPDKQKMKPGEITDDMLNREIAEQIVGDFFAAAAPDGDIAALRQHFGPLALLTLGSSDALDKAKQLVLHGSDRADGKITAKVQLVTEDDVTEWLWFTLYNDVGRPHVTLVKAAPLDDDGDASLYTGYRKVGEALLPAQRFAVTGLNETRLEAGGGE